MMESFEVDCGGCRCRESFETDEFYESIEAPKFYDFTAPEEPIYPEAWFNGNPVSVSPLLTSKSSRNGTNMHNSPSNHPILVEKFSELALKSTSVMKKTWQPSENDDPNPVTSMARNSPVVTPSQPGKHSRRPPPPAVLLGHLPVSCATDMKAALPSSQPQTTSVVAAGGKVVLGDGGSGIFVDVKLIDQSCAKSSPLKKEIPSKGVGITVVKAQRSNHGEARSSPAALLRSAPQEHSTLGTGATCKTPIKEPASSKVLEDCSEHKKLTAGNELTASPYSGHHCRSSRCAANDPNYNSPASIPRKKYLMAQQGTPGCRALFGSVRANPEYQEAGKVQNHLQQMKFPSDINMSKDRVPNNDNLEEVLVAAAYPQCDQKEMDVQKTLYMEKLQLSKESEQPLSEHITKSHTKEAVSVCKTKPRKKSTNPRPFRLRTQERGVLKEIEFNKKMEEYLAAREGFLSAFQGLSVLEPRVVGKPPRQIAKDPSMQPRHHVFSAKRADPADKVPEDDGAMKNDKQTMIHAQKMPTFDHPFKPHRSTKKLTVPQEFKFHPMNGTRTCPLHSQ
ncbi:unnamed protein product [Sphagnum troendelagicum]|uniref:TPX2 central domain-containing protein n=1 Tax=Sphagnum troendelagicum TaxID=128251 RepID=A0ABP0TCF3_9BRYO